MKRMEMVRQLEAEGFRLGFERQDTHNDARSMRMSDVAIEAAVAKGKKRRTEIENQFEIWERLGEKEDARRKLIRHLQCGSRLDTEEGPALVRAYHLSLDYFKAAEEEFQAEVRNLVRIEYPEYREEESEEA